MNSNLCASFRFLCFVLLILFQQYKTYAEAISEIPEYSKSTAEVNDLEKAQLEGLFIVTYEQNIDPEYSNLIPKFKFTLFSILTEVAVLNIKNLYHTQLNNLSFKSGYSILINAP